ncbi:unknown [Bacteroides sp. CAG:598]|nr:unknown [Bacteroides sp. CAG:598]
METRNFLDSGTIIRKACEAPKCKIIEVWKNYNHN